ncbi:peptidoglycan bridge formation glycyltransferase FemA/FemB family protein [Candidatus Gottesmanbacteria bacterium]|nr:peptidoglycan bridge formation glycyltransferase FemA/FemB family protein [Candidatus Gottesmanbacteria bacterium]
MNDIRQTSPFAQFMSDLGWDVDFIENQHIFRRHFPFVGNFAKMPRPNFPLSISKLKKYMKSQNVFRLKLSPFLQTRSRKYVQAKKSLSSNGFSIDANPFNPTTTIQINLERETEKIFQSFSEAKRRGVRRALKHGVQIYETSDIFSFIAIRKHQYRPLGFLITREMQCLWENFFPEKATLLLAYTKEKRAIAGILLLISNKTAYYWYASALTEGKKLFAPTLLVWEALKVSKRKRCSIFDFEGIYDERFPKASKSFRGFTKFKEGFGGEKVIFSENFTI